MTILVLVACVSFCSLGVLGYATSKSNRWSYVDVVYYPLAAIAVGLLFAHNAAQRELFELGQLAEIHQAKLIEVSDKRPNTLFEAHDGLTSSSIGLLATIPDYGEVCEKIPAVSPRCSVAKKLAPPIRRLVDASRADTSASKEIRLASTCKAAQALLLEIRTSDAMSSLIGDVLLSHYQEALSKDFSPLAFESAREFASGFLPRALQRVDWIKGAMNMKGEAVDFVLESNREEARYGEVILQSLLPCMVAPKKDLELLVQWTRVRESEQVELKRIEQSRQAIKEAPPTNPFATKLHLLLWPYVLVAALSLKFGKGVAVVRK